MKLILSYIMVQLHRLWSAEGSGRYYDKFEGTNTRIFLDKLRKVIKILSEWPATWPRKQ